MSDSKAVKRRSRGGGGAARRAERTSVNFETAKYIERNIPLFNVLNDEALEIIETNAEAILEDVGVNFVNNPAALKRWQDAGADVDGERVRLPKGLAKSLMSTAPSKYIQYARNPSKNVVIGGNSLVCAPVYGPPFVRDLQGGRRYATMEDFNKFVKLGYMSKWLHHSGGTVCEPTDIPVNKRHLDMLHAHMTLSDKPFMGSVTEPSRAQDSVEMCEILFGKEFVQENAVMTSLININSPMTFDDVMMGALEVYSKNNQACIVSPFIVGGAMAPVSVAGTLTQVLAEVMAGISYSQLVRPGAPVIFGAFVSSIDMNSGAPTFGTPEASQILYGAGQLARRFNLPFRSGGSLCGSKLPDAQAAYETTHTLNAALLGGVNFMLHACGWLEGGLSVSYEKIITDVEVLNMVAELCAGEQAGVDDIGFESALSHVDPSGHFFASPQTMERYTTEFYEPIVHDYANFGTWTERGSKDASVRATEVWEEILSKDTSVKVDGDKVAALQDFIAKRTAQGGAPPES